MMMEDYRGFATHIAKHIVGLCLNCRQNGELQGTAL